MRQFSFRFVEFGERQSDSQETTVQIRMTLKSMDNRLRLLRKGPTVLSDPAEYIG